MLRTTCRVAATERTWPPSARRASPQINVFTIEKGLPMKKVVMFAVLAAFAAPVAVVAQGNEDRLASLEEIVVTADKQQPAGYTADAATEALLAEIAQAK